jgi:hypothetical protein
MDRLVMADALALDVLRSGARPDWLEPPLRIVIAEGEPDWLTWSIRRAFGSPTPAYGVLGIVVGSWSEELAARIPDGSRVTIRTDHDEPGEKYAVEIASTLAHRCKVLRSKRTP